MFKASAFAGIAIFFLAACAQADNKKDCVVAGCSGQLCVERGDNGMSNCMWSESYRCYKSVGRCERQPDGKCGWTPTEELSQCLTKANSRPPFLPPLTSP